MGSRGRDWAGEVIIREERKMSVAGRVIVYGGRGALGSAIVAHFKAKSWWVANIDMKENDEADANGEQQDGAGSGLIDHLRFDLKQLIAVSKFIVVMPHRYRGSTKAIYSSRFLSLIE